ncbi:MAG: bifunctional phosphopantothenoylcysteine decarboxylase/phosphopantothenate--cysteine ligase CoaBC [Deltaproteobacteria bacterium]|nr:bifunctional phosphopantothenoylcysteine decarboxylase/phosphopantothenate--cysteine ligase CoaBC [Deltaproteobacteria bacterium]MBW1826767.1 bifunctional phosphopantothenoylcysteine decarboxylase/phosphopantothenate--cysteine ligase CoaBC [Deltaproteobacteria bacterium]MBW1968190.1 bifunctional phosphopantothenoylcysteine decarboxylase/phosphopantothenate--cysteine ligase CoaBC [Deltaproteobacteria bacterium]MBW2155537.1 bifunctional phosphopantothenoylcysteine decarboxylase/phosphopantothen
MKTVIEKKNIILGVSGGIAAYKSVELLRLLVKQGANVRVIMTENAQWFVGPLTFEALSAQPVCTDLFEKNDDASIRHIQWAEAADAVVIAPATANIIGKLSSGIADDALSTFLLAVICPVIVCPSMNTHMFESRAVQRNLETLRADGHFIVAPESGTLACGTTGPGRLPEPEDIVDRIAYYLSTKDLKDKKILVTSGPTREPVDPVRFISNPSSGKMGFAVARAAEYRGGAVTLITGPTHLPDPNNVKVFRIQTAREMARAVFENVEHSDIIIKTAAVSDYRPKDPATQKIKKEKGERVLYLERTQDILKEIGRRKKDQILVGFAAETENLEQHAETKRVEKNLDIIVGNIVGEPSSGFGADTNKVTLFYKDGTQEPLPVMGKDAVAHILLDRILKST